MKKIFLLSSELHGYEKIIIKNFLKLNYQVDFLDYSKKNYKKARKINNIFLNIYNNIYLRKIKKINIKDILESRELNKDLYKINGEEYLYFIKIGPIFLEESSLKIIKEKFKICISHHWDRIEENNKDKFLLEKLFFDKISTYSREDSLKYKIKYLPNFYYYTCQKSKNKITKGVFTIMSDFSRYQLLEKICLNLRKNRVQYDINLVTTKDIKSELISIRKEFISLEKMLTISNDYKVILELVRERNKGCSTFRAIECIGMKKKLITNNKDIIFEDYYNKNNILIIDEKNINIPAEFIESPYKQLSKEIVSKYDIKNWIKKLIEIRK